MSFASCLLLTQGNVGCDEFRVRIIILYWCFTSSSIDSLNIGAFYLIIGAGFQLVFSWFSAVFLLLLGLIRGFNLRNRYSKLLSKTDSCVFLLFQNKMYFIHSFIKPFSNNF